MKCIIIIPYFGKFPSFFQLFLDSCALNPEFDWLILTDNENIYKYPKNVKCKILSFDQIKEKISSKFDFPIVLERPHKLCDYKVSYGYIFDDQIRGYDYWGHGDLDVIYGSLSKFLRPLMKEGYDKIYSLGHLSIYKNTPEINKAFKNTYNNVSIYKKVFSSDYGFAFDEWHCKFGGINDIFEDGNYKFFKYNHCANLDSAYNGFKLSNYIINFGNYSVNNNHSNIFKYENGNLIRYYIRYNKLESKEYPYIHFHKRSMSTNTNDRKNYLIVPNEFIDDQFITLELIRKHSKLIFFNAQYVKTKIINFKYRLKQFFN